MLLKTDGPADVFEPHNRNSCPHNRNICQTGWGHAWLILLFALVAVVIPLLMYHALNSMDAPVWRKFFIYRKVLVYFSRFHCQKYEINKSPRCAPFRMKCSKSRRFLGLCPRPRWGAYDAPLDTLIVKG